MTLALRQSKLSQSKLWMCDAAVAEPETRKRHATNIVDAQFSVYFLAAAALLTGGVRWDDYPQLLGRADVNALADRVVVTHDADIEALYPHRMAGSVRVTCLDGRPLISNTRPI